MPERRDLWVECYRDDHADNLSEQAFKYQFCSVCRNSGCTNSAVGRTRWQGRIETQVDRLLDNPEVSDPNDPRYRETREMGFKDLFREAMKLEIADKKGDWEPVNEKDAMEYAVEMSRPAGFEPDPDPDPDPVIVRQEIVPGTAGNSYTVTVGEYQDQPVYDCTCKAFEFDRVDANGMCKHIRKLVGVVEPEPGQKVDAKRANQAKREPVLPPTPTRKAPGGRFTKPSPEQWLQVSERNLAPKANNTTFPSEGLMVDGSPAPPRTAPPSPVDPWAPAPESTGTVIEVGGSIVLGGDEEEE